MVETQKQSDQEKLVRSFETRLEVFAEKVLMSQLSGHKSVLEDVQVRIERVFINAALKISKNNVSKAAKLLGMNRNTLNRKIKEYA